VVSVLSLPDRGSAVEIAVRELWDDLQIVDGEADLSFLKKKPKIAEGLAPFSDTEVLAAIRDAKGGKADERPVKQVELQALLAAPEGFVFGGCPSVASSAATRSNNARISLSFSSGLKRERSGRVTGRLTHIPTFNATSCCQTDAYCHR
jgi:hypothetical protein